MTSLDFHAASPEERLAAYRNVIDVWPYGDSPEEHLQRRLASVQHQAAQFYVGCVNGQVVVSLACYDLDFLLQGEVTPGFAVGSVHTLPEHRGRGYAPALLQYVEQTRHAAGCRIAMLYSDIGIEYYRRFGYQPCPSHQGTRAFRPAESGRPSPAAVCTSRAAARHDESPPTAPWRLTPADIERDREALRACYAHDHGSRSISIARSLNYWLHLERRRPQARFFWLLDGCDQRRGYARLEAGVASDGAAELLDLAFAGPAAPSAETQRTAYKAILAWAHGRPEISRLSLWLPGGVADALFEVEPRPREITMLKRLDGLLLPDDVLAAVDAFQAIDHV